MFILSIFIILIFFILNFKKILLKKLKGIIFGYFSGEKFRVKMNLPSWYTDEDIASFLLE